MQRSFVNHELDAATQQSLFGGVCDGIKSGALAVTTTVAGGADQIAGFFRSLLPACKAPASAPVELPAELVTPEGSRPDLAVSMTPQEVEPSAHASSVSAASAQTTVLDAVQTAPPAGDAAQQPSEMERRSGTYRVDYQVGGRHGRARAGGAGCASLRLAPVAAPCRHRPTCRPPAVLLRRRSTPSPATSSCRRRCSRLCSCRTWITSWWWPSPAAT